VCTPRCPPPHDHRGGTTLTRPRRWHPCHATATRRASGSHTAAHRRRRSAARTSAISTRTSSPRAADGSVRTKVSPSLKGESAAPSGCVCAQATNRAMKRRSQREHRPRLRDEPRTLARQRRGSRIQAGDIEARRRRNCGAQTGLPAIATASHSAPANGLPDGGPLPAARMRPRWPSRGSRVPRGRRSRAADGHGQRRPPAQQRDLFRRQRAAGGRSEAVGGDGRSDQRPAEQPGPSEHCRRDPGVQRQEAPATDAQVSATIGKSDTASIPGSGPGP